MQPPSNSRRAVPLECLYLPQPLELQPPVTTTSTLSRPLRTSRSKDSERALGSETYYGPGRTERELELGLRSQKGVLSLCRIPLAWESKWECAMGPGLLRGASPCHRPQFRDLLQRYESNMLRRPCHLAGQAGLHVPLPVPPHGFHHLGAAGAGGTVRRRFRALRPGGSGLRHGKSADHGLRPRGT